MIDSTASYKAAIVADARRMYLKAVIDIIDPDIVVSEVAADSKAPWSQDGGVYDHRFTTERYVTGEHNRFLLDGSAKLFPVDYQVSDHLGFAGEVLSGEDGSFSPAVWVELDFSNVSILQALSVYFPTDEVEGYAVDFTIDVLSNGTTYYSENFAGNSEREIQLEGFTVHNPDAIRLTVTKWSLPSRRMRVPEILPGIYEEWDAGMLASFDVKHQGDPSGASLPYGTCTLKMDNLSRRFEPRAKNGLFKSIEERQGIDISIGVETENGPEYQHVGVFYQYSGGWKTGDNGLTMQWTLVDIVGLLANREYIPPSVLPTTLEGWIASIVSQLGANFSNAYTVDEKYKNAAVTANSILDVTGKKCGDILRFACMAAGVWARAGAETGKLAVEPLWSEGNKITLDNLSAYPIIKSNNDLAAIVFTLHGSSNTQYVVSGNATASSETVSIDNPFLHTEEQALTAARLILSCYGGNRIELTGRGDPASEIGDVDTVWLDESSATTARRIQQTLKMSGGVLQGCQSTLLQADGSFLFEERAVLTTAQTWTAPEGVTQLRIILVGPGGDGTDGTNGTWDAAGQDGTDGLGGLVWAQTVAINAGQSFAVTFGEHTTFGQYSSANGKRFPYGYTDIASGDSFARTGVAVPESGTGDGGAGGRGGVKGNKHGQINRGVDEDGNPYTEYVTVIDNYPGTGTSGVDGAPGCVVLYWDKEET